jgi:hypothetical protein
MGPRYSKQTYYKIINENFVNRGFQYKQGLNVLKNPKKTYYKSIHKQKTNETALKDEFLKNYLKKVKPENL